MKERREYLKWDAACQKLMRIVLEDDNHGLVSGETGAATGTGLDKPDDSDSNETRDTCIGRVILGLKELCRKNGVNEILTASLVGRVAIDLCKATKE